MTLRNWIKNFLRFFDRLGGSPPPEPETPPFPKEDIGEWGRGEEATYDWDKELRLKQIRLANQKRRTKFKNAEHFKRRQPTTARMLWKPDAKIEDED